MQKYLKTHIDDLYLLRFSAMCKPAGEVANLTQLESQTTRGRTLIMWRVAAGHIAWGPREVELMYQSTLDSISEAFDVFHYPISRYMLDARAEIFEAGVAPEVVQKAVFTGIKEPPPQKIKGETLLLASEVSQCGDPSFLEKYKVIVDQQGIQGTVWAVPGGALAYSLGARELARQQAEQVAAVIRNGEVKQVIADGPETAWALKVVFPALGLSLPDDLRIRLFSEVLAEKAAVIKKLSDTVFVHDSRPAYFLSDKLPGHRAILTGIDHEESNYGEGAVFEAPRKLVAASGARCVTGTWVRGLAKTCGADDGLWLTYPDLAEGLAQQRLDYASHLKAECLVTDSPLSAFWLGRCRKPDSPEVRWLPDLITD